MKLIKLMIKLLFLIVAFYAFLLFSIMNLSRKSNLALEKNVGKVLHPHHIGNMNCEMASFMSRTGKCVFSASSKQIKKLITDTKMKQYIAVDLDKVDLDKVDSIEITRLPTFNRLCEEIQYFKESSSVNIYQLHKDNPRLLLKPGSFDYLILYHHQKNNESCVQVGYSYG